MERELVQDGSGNYLRVTGGAEETFSDKIFSYQEIPGFLPPEIQRINGKKECIYDVSGKIPLAQYLSETTFTEKEIRHIFLQLLDMGERLEEYLLDSNGLVVQEEFLFIERESGQVAGIFNPDLRSGNVSAFGHLSECIMEKMNQEDKELVFFIYGIHKLTKEAGCTKGMLRNYVKEKREQSKKHEPAPSYEPLPISDRISDRKQSAGIRLIPGMFLAAGILAIVIIWNMGVFQKPLSGQTDWVKFAGVTAFFMAAAGYGAWKTMPLFTGQRAGGREAVTEYEEERNGKRVCLIPLTAGGDIIEIGRFPYLLGGAGERADTVIRNTGKGKVRVRILQEGGNILVSDEESEEGIYRNDDRLVAWQKTPLYDGDFLRFEKNEYVVEITQPEYVI